MILRSLAAALAAAWLFSSADGLRAEPLTPLSSEGLADELALSEGKVVLINLWATWCSPCLKEIPDLLALEQELSGDDFRLLAISMDDIYSEGWVNEFKAKHFPDLMSFINAEMDMDTLVSALDPAWNETLPTSYILNREGEVVHKIQGKKPIDYFRSQVIAAGL